jgi:hypothetical protein
VPVIKNGRVCLPIGPVISFMGGTTQWDQATQQVTVSFNGTTIVLTIGSATATVNGQPETMDVAPYISDSGRTMIPLSFVTNNLGCKTTWDGTTQTVTIYYP